MKYLSAFYEANTHEAGIQEKLKKYPEPKMIALLSDNSKCRQYLENTVYSWEKFTQQVLHIIDEENLSYWDYYVFQPIIKPQVDKLHSGIEILELHISNLQRQSKAERSTSSDAVNETDDGLYHSKLVDLVLEKMVDRLFNSLNA